MEQVRRRWALATYSKQYLAQHHQTREIVLDFVRSNQST
jgi:hypothetical protein